MLNNLSIRYSDSLVIIADNYGAIQSLFFGNLFCQHEALIAIGLSYSHF